MFEVTSWEFWIVWLILFGILFLLSSYMEKKAALRGTHREPLSPWIDKGLRTFFLILFCYPLTALLGVYITLALFVLYLPSFIDGSEKRGRMSNFLKKDGIGGAIFKWIGDYFSIDYDSEDGYRLEANRGYVIGVHPHGLLPVASSINVLSDTSRMHNEFFGKAKIRMLAASMCFLTPIYRDVLVGGGVIDAARYNARQALNDGYSLALVPGGATEALYASPGRHAVFIKSRRGFIKLAIETGCPLVPCYSFGECDLYGQLSTSWPVVTKIQKKFQAVFGISLPLVTNILPRKTKVVTVAAKPIEVTKNENPTDEEVDKVLKQYIEALERVFHKFAPKYIADPAQRKLEIH